MPRSKHEEIEWKTVLGPYLDCFRAGEVQELNRAVIEYPRRSIRLHPARSDSDLPFETDLVPWHHAGRFLSEDVLPGSFLNHAAGDYYVQDSGSLLAVELCDLRGDELVLDACAAPGGKSTAILEGLNPSGLLVANEVIGSRLLQLRLACEKTGRSNYMIFHREIDELEETFASRFDCVLVDAPCSGQSMLARGKQTMGAFSETQIEHNASRQNNILTAAAKLVRPGGKLVYSTCTFSYRENEGAIKTFLDQHSCWKCAAQPSLDPWESPVLPGSYRLWPHRDRCGGAFAVALQRSQDEVHLHGNKGMGICPSKMKKSKHWKIWSADEIGQALPFMKITKHALDDSSAVLQNMHSSQKPFLNHISTRAELEWLKASIGGPVLATQQGNRWEPSYWLARASLPGIETAQVDLSDEQASKYVSGEVVHIESHVQRDSKDSAVGGWCVALWKDRALGWGKLSGKQLKNHFPKSLRQNVRKVHGDR